MKYFKDSEQLIECIPNFSEGRDKVVVQKLVDSIKDITNIKVLHVDMGYDANRTVITFVGSPIAVLKASYIIIKTAAAHIDMTKHQGEHPRMGAIDVFPLVPLRNISMNEVIQLSYQLAEKVGKELNIPIYLYEKSAKRTERSNLAFLRKGEYEDIPTKLKNEKWQPDFGPLEFKPKVGMTALGARNFLIAYNINLTTLDVRIAKKIAGRIRESGRKINGEKIPGLFNGVKAIGWLMDEYNCAQVSTNITDIESTGIHEVFEAVKAIAEELNTTVNGSELIGLIPELVLLKAGRYYSSTAFHDSNNSNLIKLAIKFLGINTYSDRLIEERIIENLI